MKIKINESTPVFNPFELKILFESVEEAEALYSLCNYISTNRLKSCIDENVIISANEKKQLKKSVTVSLTAIRGLITNSLENKITIQE